MSTAKTLLPELDNELTVTRTVLERVPADRTDWKPHVKSWNLGDLSLHIANLLSWMEMTLTASEYDLAPVGGPAFTPPTYESPAATLARFDANCASGKAALAAASDEDLAELWSLKAAGQVHFSMPRSLVLRTFVLNHMIHHRGQLTVYLRQCDVPLPSVYGPSADEGH